MSNLSYVANTASFMWASGLISWTMIQHCVTQCWIYFLVQSINNMNTWMTTFEKKFPNHPCKEKYTNVSLLSFVWLLVIDMQLSIYSICAFAKWHYGNLHMDAWGVSENKFSLTALQMRATSLTQMSPIVIVIMLHPQSWCYNTFTSL